MNLYGLSDRERELICGVLRHHAEVTEARIFGSRANGQFRPNSDIDLALCGNIPLLKLASIAGELEELPLPYKFDVETYSTLSYLPLREHIDRFGKTFYSR